MWFAKCRFPLVLDTKKCFPLQFARLSHQSYEASASPHPSALSQCSPSIAPAPQRCDDECNIYLHLLGAPTCVRVPGSRQCLFQNHPSVCVGQDNIPHVGRRLNRGHELERNVDQTDERNDGSRDVVPEPVSANNAADEEVDCGACWLAGGICSPSKPIEAIVVFLRLLLIQCISSPPPPLLLNRVGSGTEGFTYKLRGQ